MYNFFDHVFYMLLKCYLKTVLPAYRLVFVFVFEKPSAHSAGPDVYDNHISGVHH